MVYGFESLMEQVPVIICNNSFNQSYHKLYILSQSEKTLKDIDQKDFPVNDIIKIMCAIKEHVKKKITITCIKWKKVEEFDEWRW